MARKLDSKTVSSAALDLIDAELVALTDDPDTDALMIFLPPQEGKSQRVSRRYPEWRLEHDPSLRIAIVSYMEELALRWGRDIKQDIRLAQGELPISIRQDSGAAGRWETPQGGGVYCVGVGGPLSGKPVDLLIIDDPVKDRAAAESATVRDSTWDWWESVALERLGPGSKVVLVMTRWHEDDLAGRILSRPSPLRWRVVKIPAIATGPDDPLGRQPGEELVSVRGRAPGHFTNMRAGVSPYVFSGVYQQDPTAAEGNFFRRAAFRYWRAAPGVPGRAGVWIDMEGRQFDLADPAVWRFATVDVAASTSTRADFTVCSVWAIDRGGDLVLLDRRRQHVEMADHFAMVAPLRARWGFDICYVERQFYSKTLVADAQNAGIPVALVDADTDKVTRAIPAAGRVHAGRVWFPAQTAGCECGHCPDGAWLDEWCDELAAFPTGTHDDQVDTLSYAARIAAAHWLPPAPPPRPRAMPADLAAIDEAYSAAMGNGHGPGGAPELDLMNMPLG
jgi:predicted phage terminase large subunit-like protein